MWKIFSKFNIFNIKNFFNLLSNVYNSLVISGLLLVELYKVSVLGFLLTIFGIIICVFLVIFIVIFLMTFSLGSYFNLLDSLALVVDQEYLKLEEDWACHFKKVYMSEIWELSKPLQMAKTEGKYGVFNYNSAMTFQLVSSSVWNFLSGKLFWKSFLFFLYNNKFYLFVLFFPVFCKYILIFLIIKFLLNLLIYFLDKLDFFSNKTTKSFSKSSK